ncbi:HpcH/HpaI aldolase family protein [Shinella pollutisoli]|uniref:HpcH/HpaI aldolase/citrate lyase family protein n=1 Tax=Shinella pollutisoli TaxID=2250594 RepID=A0ABV7DAW8_9HYPH|nr:aldolase/citrate lyase family protein [Shinella pollutisoli]
MRPNRVRERWNAGEAAVSGWLSFGNSYTAEIVGLSGVDCVTIDLQHAMTDVSDMIVMLQAISATPATPFVRVPNAEPGIIMKALDAGSYGIICPLVNSVGDAKALVDASSYPPLGGRSFGPARGLLYGGPDYAQHADATIVRLAMIETREGLAAVDDICAVDGLDGIFVGPSDLGLNLGRGTAADPSDSDVRAAIDRCLAAAKAAGKRAGLFCPSGAVARRRAEQGFDFVVPNSDANLLKAALAAELAVIGKA